MNKKKYVEKTHYELLMEKDRWHASELGLSLSAESSKYFLSFANLKPAWLKEVSKQFIYQQALTKTYGTCSSHIKALVSFGSFITGLDPSIKSEHINRKLMVDYIHELCTVKKLKPNTVGSYLSNIKYFFQTNLREKWFPPYQETLIFIEDFPRNTILLPKFIPEYVIKQLLKHLPNLPETDQRLLTLFLETGRRCGEIFTLPYHCLQTDNTGDYFLKIADRKMKKHQLIPISENCVQCIREQQAYVDKLTSAKENLFVVKRKGVIQAMKSRAVCFRLNKLAKEKNIVDENDCLWHFHFHQFRHTVATRMINNGVSQHMVQLFLGHVSPEMTKRYSTIHDSTLKDAFNKFQKRLFKPPEGIRMREALSDPDALGDLQQQLKNIKKCVEMARTKEWDAVLANNIQRKEELEKMIAIIERGNIDAKNEA